MAEAFVLTFIVGYFLGWGVHSETQPGRGSPLGVNLLAAVAFLFTVFVAIARRL